MGRAAAYVGCGKSDRAAHARNHGKQAQGCKGSAANRFGVWSVCSVVGSLVLIGCSTLSKEQGPSMQGYFIRLLNGVRPRASPAPVPTMPSLA